MKLHLKLFKKISTLVSSLLLAQYSYGATNASVTQLMSNYGNSSHYYIMNLDFRNTPSGWSPSSDPSRIYTGIIFNGYETMNIAPGGQVIVIVESAQDGGYNDWAGMLFRGIGKTHYRINGGFNRF